MSNPIILIGLTLTLVIFVSGCAVTEESVKEINQKIEDRYNSFSTLKYTITELRYEDGTMNQKQEYTEMFKKPDKIKQVFGLAYGQNSQNFYICNGYIAYSQITPDLMSVYEYVDLPPEMTTYCGYFINKGAEKWKVPMEITDETKYKVETSKVNYNGKDAIKAVVTILMSEEAKQKQTAIGKTPRETVVTYWFDTDNFAILKEESQSYSTQCEVSAEIGGESSQGNCIEIENKIERVYEGFYFDEDIADSEFEINPSDYPNAEFKKEIVDAQEKFD
ncbi:hypothetical protein HYW19_01705 [Candidatus Woesearchaeota archaeon]|nr:hypothetical protein [Candidatus Woesearchaeota archaeon]